MNIISLAACVFIWWVACGQCKSFALARAKGYKGSTEVARKDVAKGEPTCEELKVMWRFSKRQSRASEITNEIPTYSDPFSYNVWQPFYAARSRSMGGLRINGRYKPRPVYGRVVHKPPVLRIQDIADRNRAFEEVARMYGTGQSGAEPRRRMTAFRLSGGGHMFQPALTPQSGSFQHLKELIRTERARELQLQREAEEAAARAAALKELSGGSNLRSQANLRDMGYNYDTDESDDQPENFGGREGIMVFPDPLAPASRVYQDGVPMQDYYIRNKAYQNAHGAPLFDSSPFNNDMDGMIL